LWGVIFTYGAGILAEADVEDPVKLILDGPMASHGDGELFGGQLARSDVITPLRVRPLIADLAQGVDQTDRLALGSIDQVSCPFRGQDRGDLTDDPTAGLAGLAVAVDGFRLVLINEISLDGLQQRRLIAFDRQQVVTALNGDLTGDFPLAPDDVDVDHQTLDIQCLKQLPNGGDLITLGGDLLLTENDTQFRREGTDHVNGRLTAATRPTHRRAIERNAAFRGAEHLGDPATERCLELLRVHQRPEDPQRRFLGGNALPEHQKLTQPIILVCAFDRRCRRRFRDRSARGAWQLRESPRRHATFHCRVFAGHGLPSSSISRRLVSLDSFWWPKQRRAELIT